MEVLPPAPCTSSGLRPNCAEMIRSSCKESLGDGGMGDLLPSPAKSWQQPVWAASLLFKKTRELLIVAPRVNPGSDQCRLETRRSGPGDVVLETVANGEQPTWSEQTPGEGIDLGIGLAQPAHPSSGRFVPGRETAAAEGEALRVDAPALGLDAEEWQVAGALRPQTGLIVPHIVAHLQIAARQQHEVCRFGTFHRLQLQPLQKRALCPTGEQQAARALFGNPGIHAVLQNVAGNFARGDHRAEVARRQAK